MHAARFTLFCLTLSLLTIGAAAAQPDADPYQPPMLEQRYHDARLAVGDWSIKLRSAQRWLPVQGSVTAMAFGPGRNELALSADEGPPKTTRAGPPPPSPA